MKYSNNKRLLKYKEFCDNFTDKIKFQKQQGTTIPDIMVGEIILKRKIPISYLKKIYFYWEPKNSDDIKIFKKILKLINDKQFSIEIIYDAIK